jgi:hypothetical protein
MLFSSVAIDHLLLFAMFGSFFTLFPGVVIQLLKLMDVDDEPFGKRQYFNLAKMTFMTGVLFAGIAVCIHIFAPDNVVPNRNVVGRAGHVPCIMLCHYWANCFGCGSVECS